MKTSFENSFVYCSKIKDYEKADIVIFRFNANFLF